jgi:glutamate racemase
METIHFNRMKKHVLLIIWVLVAACQGKPGHIPVVDAALNDTTSVFYTDFTTYPTLRNHLPIGVFDSGTGGLTVLEAILSSRLLEGEDFIYLADQANMPYGNYAAEGKTDFLRELIIKDALFLLGHQVKILVVACNTATAYGLEDITNFLEDSGSGIKAIGVINAGVKAALDRIDPKEDVAVGVLATTGTIASGGYENTFRSLAKERGYTGNLQIISHGAAGFAEAVDSEKDYVDPRALAPRGDYRGPSTDHPVYRIDTNLLAAYGFDFSANHILYKGSKSRPRDLQLNSTENYARYHLLSLVEKLRKTKDPQPLRYLVLGCTHFPYQSGTLSRMLTELREYEERGEYPYRDLIDEKVTLIDPAFETARELYTTLVKDSLLTLKMGNTQAAFYISVPLEDAGRFSYAYKYGRDPGVFTEDVNIVPFSVQNIDSLTRERLRSLRFTWPLLPFGSE